VRSHDISAKGIGLLCDRYLPEQTPLELFLPVPEKGETYYTRGKVAWSKLIKPNNYKMGVTLDKTDLVGMAQFINPS